jgi:dGTPase
LEFQVVDAADSIAYDAHDADDAVELGLLATDDLSETELWREAGRTAQAAYSGLSDDEFRRAAVHAMIESLTSDVIESSRQRLKRNQFSHASEVALLAEPLVRPSDEAAAQKKQMEAFLFERVYRHSALLVQRERASDALRELFTVMTARPDALPGKYIGAAKDEGVRRATADYIAGMTDRFAWDEHRKYRNSAP